MQPPLSYFLKDDVYPAHETRSYFLKDDVYPMKHYFLKDDVYPMKHVACRCL